MPSLDYSIHAVAELLEPRGGSRRRMLYCGQELRSPLRRRDFGTVATFRQLLKELVDDGLTDIVTADISSSQDQYVFEVAGRHGRAHLVVTPYFGRYEANIDVQSETSSSFLRAASDDIDYDLLPQLRNLFYRNH